MEKDYDLVKTRKNVIAKDNKMIQQGRYSLSSIENKAILYIISKIRPGDKVGTIYHFNCQEFNDLIKWGKGSSYKKIKQMLTKLGSLQWWIDLDDEQEALIRWFDIVHMNKGTGDIELSFHSDMFPFLLKLQESRERDGHYYTSYKLQNITLMKNKYSPRIYELLKSYSNNSVWCFENGTGSKSDIQRRIANVDAVSGKPIIPKGWSNWAIFKRDVLEPVKREINLYTDLRIDYDGKKENIKHQKSRSTDSIEFYIVNKTLADVRETEKIIDQEYVSMVNEQGEESVKEHFFRKQAEKKKEEEQAIETRKIFERQKKINESLLPVLTEALMEEYSVKQIEQLYKIAIMNRTSGIVPYNVWELYATDLITYYNDKIKATNEDTKTSAYKRLRNAVKEDYDNMVPQLLETYKNMKKV